MTEWRELKQHLLGMVASMLLVLGLCGLGLLIAMGANLWGK